MQRFWNTSHGCSCRAFSPLSLAVGLVLAVGLPTGSPAKEPNPTDAALKAIADTISTHYVFIDLRQPIVEALQVGASHGRYDASNPSQFSALVTEDLRQVSHDGHLFLVNDPAQYAALVAPPASDAGIEAFHRMQSIRLNHGLTEMKVLPENIRYLKLEAFKWVPDGSTMRAYDDAADFLRGGDAIVVDLRGNGGGESDAADYFLAHILTLGAPEGERARKPVFLLIDGSVGSAAEAVAYDAKLRGTATLVGATSYGAANNSKRFPIAPTFVLSISYHRPIHPLSGTNWEGAGVVPDITVAPSLALETAEMSALTALNTRAPSDSPLRSRYAWRLAWLEARIHPPTLSVQELRALEGKYGPIELRYETDSLRLYRADRPRWPQGGKLTPLSNNAVFSLEGTDDLRLHVTAKELHILRPGATPESYPAVSSATP